MQGLGPVIGDAWRLFSPYFLHSRERVRALLVLGVLLGMNFAQVELGVLSTFWSAQFLNALQAKDVATFWQLMFTYRLDDGHFMPGFPIIIAGFIVLGIYSVWVQQWLQIHWRAWLTNHILERWLSDRAYYQVSLTADPLAPGTDNPDQRIADDLDSFTRDTLTLGLDFLSNVVSIFSYVVVLWTLSGPITLLGVTIPGYMVWIAIAYAVFGTALTHLIGRKLIPLRFSQQRLEANFRFGLMRVRENTEGIALYGGEAEERAGLSQRFGLVVHNFRALMNRTKLLGIATVGYGQVSSVFPTIVAAPRFFSGAIKFGTLNQIGQVFSQVQSALSWFVDQYASLAIWRATVGRLGTFQRAIDAAHAERADGVRRVAATGSSLAADGITLALPNGASLLDRASFSLAPGQSTVITGRSGAGKSTLFRALAGIWPFGSGRVEQPAGSTLFLPQRPYFPLGTLRHAVSYPRVSGAFDDAALGAALAAVGLGGLADALDSEENWGLRLSPGQQQQLAIARALLIRPDWLFLDEATASLDAEAEAQLYRLLRDALPGTTLISIAHRDSVVALHDRRLVLDRSAAGGGLREIPTRGAA